jgi:hypothetical protein
MGLEEPYNTPTRRPRYVKVSRQSIYHGFRSIRTLRFEDQQMTSFAGVVVFEALFQRKERVESRRRWKRIGEQQTRAAA